MIHLLGLDWKNASLDVREKFSLASGDVDGLLQGIKAAGAEGCMLLQTCNRFELYIDAESENEGTWRSLVCSAVEAGEAEANGSLHYSGGEKALEHICRVACGLHSQILGEDQILAQVKCAPKTGRQAGTSTPVLETLFRIAVTAGKQARTQVKLQSVSHSSATLAVELAAKELGGLDGMRAVVIGNGEMGRLAATMLVEKGCDVTITLRSYKHGETIVPRGCDTIAYDSRTDAMDGADLLISATKSPHYTISMDMLNGLRTLPRVVADIAVPRDIDPACRDVEGLTFIDMDDLRTEDGHNRQQVEQVEAIIAKKMEDFHKWQRGRREHAAKAQPGQRFEPGRMAVFAGTSEGRKLCAALSDAGMQATVCVATEYGRELLPAMAGMDIRSGRMDSAAMSAFLKGYDTVIDATHPYATEASENIQTACRGLGIRYMRLVRPVSEKTDNIVTVPDVAAAVEYLAGTEGNVLLTTGSKQLDEFAKLPGFEERLYARVLPDAAVIERCGKLGYSPYRLICMQGPFTRDLNAAMLKMANAKYIVTKDTGDAGGLGEKLAAAGDAGCVTVLIARPKAEEGHTLDRLTAMLTGGAQPMPAQVQAAEPPRFPLFVSLQGKPCLVVGGGDIAMRRIEVLLSFGAKVKAVSSSFRRRPEGVEYIDRKYSRGDTDGMALVVAATNDRFVNSSIAKECDRAGIPVSVADCMEECSFFFPAICRGEHLMAGVVSDGSNHSMAARGAKEIRRLLKEIEA